LLLYFSGHGVLDDQGELYLAAKDTERDLISGTAVPAAYITGEMNRSRSRRQVLIFDCCHSGAFARGAKGVAGASVGTASVFEGTGYGRVVLTATDATQYAWEGDQVIGRAENSVFTHYMIEGLRTGAADRDGDGRITLDEMYDYVYEQVVNKTPKQTPGKWSYKQQGDIVIAKNPKPVFRPAELPRELRDAVEDSRPWVREGSVHELARLLNGSVPGLSISAYEALTKLTHDDSTRVKTAASEILKLYNTANSEKDQQDKEIERLEQLYQKGVKALVAGEVRQALDAFEQVQKSSPYYKNLTSLLEQAKAMQERLARQKAEQERLRRVEEHASQPIALPKIAGKKLALIASLVVVLVVSGFAFLFVMNSQRSDVTPTVPAAAFAPMAFIPAGDFLMGSSDADKDAPSNEKPQHTVSLDAFWMDKFEVTNAQYQKCVDAGKCAAPRNSFSSTRSAYYGNSQFDNYPVIEVAWNDAKTFCEWSGKRLPTEAEWEKAARGTDGRIYPWGNIFDASKLNSSEGKRGDTTSVGSYSAGASPYGIMDLAGNMWEWVADWYDGKYYSSSPRSNPPGSSSGQFRVLRGGAWYDNQDLVRAAFRFVDLPTITNDVFGFRCARSS